MPSAAGGRLLRLSAGETSASSVAPQRPPRAETSSIRCTAARAGSRTSSGTVTGTAVSRAVSAASSVSSVPLAMEMELALRQALDNGEISAHYQPIVSLRSGEITGFEALARWKHPHQGFIPPAEFIPIAEETGLINELGAFILRQSCLRMVELADKHPGTARLTLSVNISGRQFKRPEFVDEAAAILAETGIDPSRVQLELTESVLMAAFAWEDDSPA